MLNKPLNSDAIGKFNLADTEWDIFLPKKKSGLFYQLSFLLITPFLFS